VTDHELEHLLEGLFSDAEIPEPDPAPEAGRQPERQRPPAQPEPAPRPEIVLDNLPIDSGLSPTKPVPFKKEASPPGKADPLAQTAGPRQSRPARRPRPWRRRIAVPFFIPALIFTAAAAAAASWGLLARIEERFVLALVTVTVLLWVAARQLYEPY